MSRLRSLTTRQSLLIILFILLPVIFFHRIALDGMILARGDIYAYFYPYWAARSAAFQAGHIPLWSPDVFMGVPLLANSQIGTFYPPNWFVTPFDTPTAITISLVLHVIWAVSGGYMLARRTLSLNSIPALLVGVLYGLGGYISAQVEHINQLQALSWTPWLFLIFSQMRLRPVRSTLLLAMMFALQLLAGHPQTVFITGVGIGIYGIANSLQSLVVSRQSLSSAQNASLSPRNSVLSTFNWLILLPIAALLAVALTLPQLIPTLELAGVSNRGAGMTPEQTMAFSFNPFLIGRGLLPSYDGMVFSEYLAYSGIIGLGLAVIGIFSSQFLVSSSPSKAKDSSPTSALSTQYSVLSSRLPWIIMLIVGLFLALGVYNPLYWPLTGLPGFSFFRVPARWLALVALAVAMLAGVGLQSLQNRRPRWWVLMLAVALIGGLGAASLLADRMAVDVIGSALPTVRTWIGWGVALIGLLAFLLLTPRLGARRTIPLLAFAAVIELFAASQILAYNQVSPPDVWTASRFTIDQLRVLTADQTPSGRVLSVSPLEFDPGDADALKARYAELGMTDLGIRIALVDTKLREVLAPNLSLAWGIPSIDGFDGGLLPTSQYSTFSALLLPSSQEPTTDGRLREMMALPQCNGACIPEQRWLNLTNTRYLITDKVFDVWHDDVAYDTQFTLRVAQDESANIPIDVPFEANEIVILCADGDECTPTLTLIYADGATENLQPGGDMGEIVGYTNSRYPFDKPVTPVSIQVEAPLQAVNVRALTLVDTRTGDFQQVTLPPWQRILSSDIKLYENQTVLPRAFLSMGMQSFTTEAEAVNLMRNFDLSPDQVVVVPLPWPPVVGGSQDDTAQITSYTAERVEVQVNSISGGYLVLTDAYYPGWVATINGQETPIYRTDIMFRGVVVPTGQSTVVFTYQPAWWPGVLIVGAVAWFVVGFAWLLVRNRNVKV